LRLTSANAARGHGLCLNEQIIGKIERGLHDCMVHGAGFNLERKKQETTETHEKSRNQRVLDIHTLIHQVNGQTVTISFCFVPFRDFRGSHSRFRFNEGRRASISKNPFPRGGKGF
jgi:hypothetical protein